MPWGRPEELPGEWRENESLSSELEKTGVDVQDVVFLFRTLYPVLRIHWRVVQPGSLRNLQLVQDVWTAKQVDVTGEPACAGKVGSTHCLRKLTRPCGKSGFIFFSSFLFLSSCFQGGRIATMDLYKVWVGDMSTGLCLTFLASWGGWWWMWQGLWLIHFNELILLPLNNHHLLFPLTLMPVRHVVDKSLAFYWPS